MIIVEVWHFDTGPGKIIFLVGFFLDFLDRLAYLHKSLISSAIPSDKRLPLSRIMVKMGRYFKIRRVGRYFALRVSQIIRSSQIISMQTAREMNE